MPTSEDVRMTDSFNVVTDADSRRTAKPKQAHYISAT